jgi:KRAB domain-containing zinc finger protein
MVSHVGTQTEDKPYECNICDKRFSQLNHLAAHKITHIEDKPGFICDVCNKSFAYASSLKVHMGAHNGDKPHECDVCNKRFLRFGDLNRHKRTHTGDKPHKCDTAICIQAQTASIFARLFTFETGRLPLETEMFHRSCDVSH